MSPTRVTYPPLDATSAQLAQWLSNYTRWMCPPPTFAAQGRGHHCLRWARSPDSKTGDSPIILEMELVHVVDGHEVPNHHPSPSRAISFTIVPFPPAQAELAAECRYDPANRYFHTLLKAIGRRWQVSSERSESAVEASTDRAHRQSITHTAPAVEKDRDTSAPEVEQVIVPLDRWDVHSHLRALCSSDPRFSLWGNVKTNEDLENLTVLDSQAIKHGKRAPHTAAIGTVQLLAAGSGTSVMFVLKDLRFLRKIPDKARVLFREFARVAKQHFDRLTSHQVQAQPSLHARGSTGNDKTATTSIPDWVPKKRETRARWKDAYSIIQELREIYRTEYDDWDRNNPDPMIADCMDAIAHHRHWKPSAKTTGRIKRAGDNGWLEQSA